jgi:hypothetical protein
MSFSRRAAKFSLASPDLFVVFNSADIARSHSRKSHRLCYKFALPAGCHQTPHGKPSTPCDTAVTSKSPVKQDNPELEKEELCQDQSSTDQPAR